MASTQTPGPGPVNASVLALVLTGVVEAVFAAEVVAPLVFDPPVLVPGEGGFGGVGVPFPFVIVAVSSVSTELLVQVRGTFVDPIEIVSVNGLVLTNCGCVIVMDDPWPAVIVPVCVAAMATAAFVG